MSLVYIIIYIGYGFVPISSASTPNQMYDEVSHITANEKLSKVGLYCKLALLMCLNCY